MATASQNGDDAGPQPHRVEPRWLGGLQPQGADQHREQRARALVGRAERESDQRERHRLYGRAGEQEGDHRESLHACSPTSTRSIRRSGMSQISATATYMAPDSQEEEKDAAMPTTSLPAIPGLRAISIAACSAAPTTSRCRGGPCSTAD